MEASKAPQAMAAAIKRLGFDWINAVSLGRAWITWPAGPREGQFSSQIRRQCSRSWPTQQGELQERDRWSNKVT